MSELPLSLREYGPRAPGAIPLVLLHGLFGSSANWHGIARRLATGRRVLVPDLRNHGRSPWGSPMDYPAMAADLAALLDAQGIERAHLIGHSMGGKAAMWLTLTGPDRVASLIVADMAPVRYASSYGALVPALTALPLGSIADRRDADRRLAAHIPNPAVRAYLLANLVRDGEGGWAWRMNLRVLADALETILGFPDWEGPGYPGPTLFLYGGRSAYVTAQGLPRIRALFPLARLRAIADAGHWVYADRPEAFVAAVTGFLKD